MPLYQPTTSGGYSPGGTDVALADGGTGASTKAAAFDALSPMTTAGDVIIGGTAGTGTRLAAGSTSGHVLTSTGSGSAPSWQAGGGGGTSYVLEPCFVATTANITIATALNAGDSIDGVSLTTGRRVLVKDQSSDVDNGIYIVGASPARSADFPVGLDATGLMVAVFAGSVNGDTLWIEDGSTGDLVGTDSTSFSQLGV